MGDAELRLFVSHIADLGRRVQCALQAARKVGEMSRTPAAVERWEHVYCDLGDDDPPGLLGSVVARSEAQNLRLSMVFALLDGRSAVDVAHIDAALAVWNYCRGSAAYIFGNAIGEPDADRLIAELVRAGPEGMTGSQVLDLFSRHTAKCDRAKQLVVSAGWPWR